MSKCGELFGVRRLEGSEPAGDTDTGRGLAVVETGCDIEFGPDILLLNHLLGSLLGETCRANDIDLLHPTECGENVLIAALVLCDDATTDGVPLVLWADVVAESLALIMLEHDVAPVGFEAHALLTSTDSVCLAGLAALAYPAGHEVRQNLDATIDLDHVDLGRGNPLGTECHATVGGIADEAAAASED